jgi:hypothetical protein
VKFDSAEVEAAFGAVFTGPPGQPDELATAIALELAAQIAPAEDVSTAATAALCGLLVGVRLADADACVPDGLPAAVEHVRDVGRARVIARHCDLGTVAAVENALARGFGTPAGKARERLLQLFELGFAIGLAARYA